MTAILLKAIVGLVPALMLFIGSACLYVRGKSVPSLLQLALVGAGCLVLVVLTHVCEAAHWFPALQWGDEHSVGHYLDFVCAILGLGLFPTGYLLHALTR